MSRHFYLGNHFYVSLVCKCQNLGNVLLRIVSTIGIGRSFFHKVTAYFIHLPIPEIGYRTPGRELCKARICINLHAPSGIVHQMEMEAVQLQQGHHFQLFQQEFLALVMAALVQHDATILESGPIQNGTACNGAVQGCHHPDRLACIEHTLLVGSFNLHSSLPNLHPIGRLQLPVGQFPAI